MRGVMIQGTASNVGKSWIATGLCRLLVCRGLAIAPFKSQNMSNNSYITRNGEEIGRAQGVQAEAAFVEATVDMNPILLKPTSDQRSEVIIHGVSQAAWSGSEYRTHWYEQGKQAIKQSVQRLEQDYDALVIEGAGSPVEVNLNDRELVNMSIADLINVPVILVADIDRGGVFASIVGTLELLPEKHRERIKGLIINKFRGERALFESGIEWIENYTGIPVLGVLPHLEDHGIEGEDSLTIQSTPAKREKSLDIAVIHWPYLSNETDISPLTQEQDVSIRYVRSVDQLGKPDALILPGTRSTIEDYLACEEKGLTEAIGAYAERGGVIVGICGGYQILSDVMYRHEADKDGVQGIGIFPLSTTFVKNKQTIRVSGHIHEASGYSLVPMSGYEIHLGRTAGSIKYPFLQLNDGPEGISLDQGRLIGTYLHDCFHNDEWRTEWLNRLRRKSGLSEQVMTDTGGRDERYERLAKHLETYLDTEKIIQMIEESAP
ncbi:cobyric acid synthase [Halobacillus shinanisalinarum]|uniref:Cobyric acid synthase n=1 Tax=Halobacillus shinanisalinarum TaxID=2932258 RepID=A0ABY4H648_9BACI|nr:cobyric acid synthase [Halobacillus shinanisalinarum]UOQ95405.1 cobyric acid synthase [Halobacillus shinanisalinarum]